MYIADARLGIAGLLVLWRKRSGAFVQMIVQTPSAFLLYYATGWEDPVINYRHLSADLSLLGEVSAIQGLSESGSKKHMSVHETMKGTQSE